MSAFNIYDLSPETREILLQDCRDYLTELGEDFVETDNKIELVQLALSFGFAIDNRKYKWSPNKNLHAVPNLNLDKTKAIRLNSIDEVVSRISGIKGV
jgi:hypothetical protein